MNKSLFIWIILLFALLSTGCSSFIKPEQPAVLDSVILDEAHSVGQTFVAHCDGMDGVEIYLEPVDGANGEIQLTLRETPQSKNLGRASLSTKDISVPGYYHFPLPIQADSNQQNYYLLLKVKGTSSFKIGTAPGNTYLNGALYQNNHPNDQRQMAFQLSYYLPRAGLGLFGEVLTWGWYLLVAGFLFVLPGWALIEGITPKHRSEDGHGPTMRNPLVKVVLAAGLGMATYPVLFSLTHAIGFQSGSLYAWGPPIIALIFLSWQYASQWRNGKLRIKLPSIQLADMVLALVVLLIAATRFWVIRSLPLPLWGDSYHHTMITQLLIDNHGLFNSWQPYTDANTFTYHFGFHAVVSVFHWITNLSAAQATLVVGQIVNIFAVLTLYPLAILIFNNRWSGTVALLVAGLLSPMPMFYVNWGRYTQLAGQVLLLVAVWFTWAIFKSDKINWRLLMPTWVVVGGLALTHYRVIIFYLIFILAYIILNAKSQTIFHVLKNALWIGTGAGIIFLPWFVNVFGGRILVLFHAVITNKPATTGDGGTRVISYSIGDLTTYLPITVWLLIVVVLAICLWRKNLEIAIIGLWWFMLVLVANPHWLKLPGKGLINNFAVFIAAYIPAGLILAAIPSYFGYGKAAMNKKIFRWQSIFLAILVISAGGWGALQQRNIVNPNTFTIAANPDIRAAEWIKDNIPADAYFLVNTFFAFYETVIVGSDGGWWLPLLAERDTTLPPITYNFESEPTSGYNEWVHTPSHMLQTHGITHPTTLAILKEHGINHVYIGQQQGQVNYSGPHTLNPEELLNDAHFELLYHQDRVWIFRFIP